MKSINFPKMLNTTAAIINEDKAATLSNMKILLYSERGEFLSDPDFGIKVKRYTYEQNNGVLRDIIIDELYTKLAIFMPQLLVNRNDIEIIQTKGTLTAIIKALNKIDYTTNLYELALFNDDNN